MLYYLYIKLIGKIVGFAAKVCERIQDVTESASIKLYEKALTINNKYNILKIAYGKKK